MRLDLAYIAAFLDCDGSLCIYRAKRDVGGFNYRPKINFYSQNLSVLHDIRDTIGGEIAPPNMSLDVHVLQLSIQEAVAAANLLLPYLRIKREQALLMIEYHKAVLATPRTGRRSGKGGSVRLSDEVLAQRHEFYLRMQELNANDPQAFRTNRVNSVEARSRVTPSQAAVGEVDTAEGVTTREVSPNNNPLHEPPARKGRHSLDSADAKSIQ
jgi:hypothetical protein